MNVCYLQGSLIVIFLGLLTNLFLQFKIKANKHILTYLSQMILPILIIYSFWTIIIPRFGRL